MLELLASLQRYVRKGGLDHWEVDGVQAIADLQYAADAVRRFPVGEQLPDAGWRPPARREFDCAYWLGGLTAAVDVLLINADSDAARHTAREVLTHFREAWADRQGEHDG